MNAVINNVGPGMEMIWGHKIEMISNTVMGRTTDISETYLVFFK